MNEFTLYEKTYNSSGLYLMLTMNRLQMLYIALIMPMFLVHPYMIWIIIGIGILSQLNLVVLSKWFASEYSVMGYKGFVELFGKMAVRILACIGLGLLLIKLTFLTLGYVEIVSLYVFPSINKNWLILFLLITSCYIAFQGMEKTIRFVVIVFLCTIWTIGTFVIFFFPPIASLHDLYPLIPSEWSLSSWKGVLIIWSSLSGPEFLIFLGPWLKREPKMLRYLSIANAISIFEYLILFVGSLLFFGSNFLRFDNFPVINMVRYLQTPLLERIDIILISMQLMNFTFAISIFLLYFYGAIRTISGKLQEKTTRVGFISTVVSIVVFIVIINEWYWKANSLTNEATHMNALQVIQIWAGAFTYLLVPSILFIAIRRKQGRV